MRVLVSGFEPFLDEKVNPTEHMVNYVNSCVAHRPSAWSGLDVRGVTLPVLFNDAFSRLKREAQDFKPQVIVSFGLASARSTVDVETLAANFSGGSQAVRGDNSGETREGEVIAGAPLAYPSTLPAAQIVKGLEGLKIPAGLSMSAGNYVCNDLFFRLQHEYRFTRTRTGFIHVPAVESGPSAFWTHQRFESVMDSVLTTLAL